MKSATKHKSACLHRSCAQPMPGYDLQLLAAFMTINSKDCQFQGSPSGFYVERMSTNAAKLLHSLPCGSCPRGPLSYTPCNAERDIGFFTPYTELIYSVQGIVRCVQYNELSVQCNCNELAHTVSTKIVSTSTDRSTERVPRALPTSIS